MQIVVKPAQISASRAMGTAFTRFCTFHILRADFNDFYEGTNVVLCSSFLRAM